MRLLLHTILGLLVLAVAVAYAADAQTVRDDVAKLNTLLKTLSSDVKLVKAGSLGIAQALQVEVDAVNIHKLLITAYNDAKASPPFGSSSFGVGLDFLKLEPQVKQTLRDVSSQKDVFGELGIIVLSSLYQLKMDTDNFGAAAVEKLALLERAIAPAILKKIDGEFNDAIVTYGGKAAHGHWDSQSLRESALVLSNGIITVLVGDAAQAYDLDACDSECGSATMMHPHLPRRILPREDARSRIT
ncbi:Cell wall galactomannoprotein [Moelleriella libera RCEF 2490]|uniref:Cell wall galactomannoprotein n=1 Tax=Moelleriella libera RCEF 2490 TaxID=1081109 RepID=A0A168ASZ7_9HYPO|nr:Cell wall galactomannoprotein [Moelleriella libera RCEF 2490]